MRAAVIGGGAWGTALATVLANNGYAVTIWSYEADVAASITERHENHKYLPGATLPPGIRGTVDLAEALREVELIVAANPSHVTRGVMAKAVPHLPSAVLNRERYTAATGTVRNAHHRLGSWHCSD